MRTVAVVQRVRAGDGIASGIDDGKMSGVRTFTEADEHLRGKRIARGHAACVRIAGSDGFARRRVMGVDSGENFPGVARIGEAGDGNVRIVWVGKISGAVGKNAAHHFSNHVHAFDVVPTLEQHTLQHVERFDDGDATGAGRGEVRTSQAWPLLWYFARRTSRTFGWYFARSSRVMRPPSRKMSSTSTWAVSPV